MIRFLKGFARYIYNLLVSFDQFVNALLLGSPDETISSRTARALLSEKPKWWVKPFAKFVNWLFSAIQVDHIKYSLEIDEDQRGEMWKWYE
jgi:hypothetical protein